MAATKNTYSRKRRDPPPPATRSIRLKTFARLWVVTGHATFGKQHTGFMQLSPYEVVLGRTLKCSVWFSPEMRAPIGGHAYCAAPRNSQADSPTGAGCTCNRRPSTQARQCKRACVSALSSARRLSWATPATRFLRTCRARGIDFDDQELHDNWQKISATLISSHFGGEGNRGNHTICLCGTTRFSARFHTGDGS